MKVSWCRPAWPVVSICSVRTLDQDNPLLPLPRALLVSRKDSLQQPPEWERRLRGLFVRLGVSDQHIQCVLSRWNH